MADTIIRHDPLDDGPYFTIARATAQDAHLSWEAWGLLSYLHSLPRDWGVSPADLIKRRKGGRDRMYRMLRELRATGYMRLIEHRDEQSGVIVRYEYLVRMRPLPDSPDTAQPHTANPHTTEKTVEDRRREPKAPRTPPKGGSEHLRTIFEAWKGATGRNGTTALDRKRIRAIKDRLDEGFTPEQLVQAVEAIPRSDFHAGRDPKTQGKTDAELKRLSELTLHLRDAQHVEYLLALAGVPSSTVGEHDPRIGTMEDPRYRPGHEITDDELRAIGESLRAAEGN